MFAFLSGLLRPDLQLFAAIRGQILATLKSVAKSLLSTVEQDITLGVLPLMSVASFAVLPLSSPPLLPQTFPLQKRLL